MSGYLEILRVQNCVMSAMAVVITGLIALGLSLFEPVMTFTLLLAMATVFLFTGAGNALNDYFDHATDARNHPERPIPRGLLTRREAMQLSLLFFSLGLVAAMLVNILTLAIAAVNLGVLFFYERWAKGRGLPGNLTVSWLTASLFIFAGVAFSGIPGPLILLMGEPEVAGASLRLMAILALLAFTASFGREVAKDVEDMEGDVDRDTLPRVIGGRQAGTVALCAFLLAVVLSPLPYMLGHFGPWYLAAVLPADAMFIYSGAVLLKDPHKGAVFSKYAMLLALVAFVVGGMAG